MYSQDLSTGAMKKGAFMNSQRGAAVVEFAIVLPLLLIILFGIIEFGLIMYNKHIITNATREGVRYGIVVDVPRRDAAKIRNKVIEWIYPDSENPEKSLLITFGDDELGNTDDDIDVRVCIDGLDCSVEGNWDEISEVTNPHPMFGDKLRVKVNYDYDFLLLPGFVKQLSEILIIKAETVMNYE